jgi:anti-sigma factor RsiW
MVTIENYEEYLMMAADGELDGAEQIALNKFLRLHPSLAAEVEAWDTMRLQPDESVVYEAKESLLKKEPKRIAIGWKPIALAAAAVLATMLIAFPALMPDNNVRISGEVLIPKITIPAAKDTAVDYLAALPVPQPLVPGMNEQKKNRKKPVVARPKLVVAQVSVRTISPITPKPIESSIVAVVPSSLQLQSQPEPIAIAKATTDQQEAPIPENKLPRIRIAQANQPALDMLKEGMEQRVTQIASAARTIRNTDFIVQIGHSSIKLN